MDIHRRAFLAQGSLTIGVLLGRRAFAQSPADLTTAAINLNRVEARRLLNDIQARGVDLNSTSAAPFIQRDADLRRQLAETLRVVPAGFQEQYVLREEQPTAEFMREEKVPLVPTPTEVQPIPVQGAKPDPGCESLVSVTVRIGLASLGFTDDVLNLLALAVEKTPELHSLVTSIGRAIGVGDFELTRDLIVLLLQLMYKKPIIRKSVVAAIGAEAWGKIKTQLAMKVGARFVPVVGQVYIIISIGLALAVNWNRMNAAFKCNFPKTA